jgi:hypothetical protein
LGSNRRNSLSFILVVLGLLVYLAPLSMHSQLPTGTILGVVKDNAENVIVGAKVTVHNDEGLTRTYTTDSTGAFRFPALPVGKYGIEIAQTGFKKITVKDVSLAVGQEAVMNFTMQVGSVSESVEVKSSVVMVDTTSSSLSSLVSETTIAELPLNGRNYVDLTLLQPGITQQTQENAGQGIGGTMYSSDGAPTRSNIVTIDGTLTINSGGENASSVAGTTLGMDGVKEYKVITNLASAEYYSGMGGQTTIVSKSGGSKLTGDVFEYLRNSSLDARNYFDPSPELLGKRLPEFRRNQFGGALGGPLKKDKTYFFVNYEGLRQTTGNPLYIGVGNTMPPECWTPGSNSQSHSILLTDNPCAAYPSGFPVGVSQNSGPPINPPVSGFTPLWTGTVNPKMVAVANLFPYPNVKNTSNGLRLDQFVYTPAQGNVENTREDYGQVRVDQNFSARDSAFGRLTIDNANVLRPDNYPQFKDTDQSQSVFLTGAENHVFSPTLLNTLRASYSRTNLSTITLPSSSAAASQIEGSGVSFINNTHDTSGDCPGGNCMIGLLVGTSLTTMGPSTVAPGYLIQNLIAVGDDIFWTKGKHAFKIGALLNHFDDPMLNDLIFGSVNVMPDVFSGVPNTGAGETYGDYLGDSILQGYALAQSFEKQVPTPSDTLRDYRYWTFGAYLQDDWRTTSRLTVNLGVRYETDTVPSDSTGKNYGLSNILTGDVSSCSTTNNPASCISQKGQLWKNPNLKNFSPRVGFAWDVRGNGKTSVKAGYGIYYDLSNLGNKLGQQAIMTPPNAYVENVFANYGDGSRSPVYIFGPPSNLSPLVGGNFPFWPFEIPHYVNAPNCNPSNAGLGTVAGPSSILDGYNNSVSCLTPQIAGNEYNPKTTYMQQYNLAIQQQLPGSMVLSAAYVGSRGIHIRRVTEGNPVIPCNMPGSTTAANDPTGCGVGTSSDLSAEPWNKGLTPVWDPALYPGNAPIGANYRVNPNVATWVKSSSDGDSWYSALQTSVAKQFSKGLQFQVAFTWSKLQDTTQGDIGSLDEGADLTMNPFNPKADKGPTAFDSKANLRANMVYKIPDIHSNSALAMLAKGWTFSNIAVFQSGYPFECMLAYGSSSSNAELGIEDVGGNVANNRCDFVTTANLADAKELDPSATPYDKKKVILHKATQWFNPDMFTLPHPASYAAYQSSSASGFMGDSPRGLMRGPGQVKWDASLVKNTKVHFLGDNGNIQFRADGFNMLNHTNFAFPTSNLYNSTFEAITTANLAGGGSDVAPNAGKVLNTLINSRQFQFAVKIDF